VCGGVGVGVGKTALLRYLHDNAAGCHIARSAGVESELSPRTIERHLRKVFGKLGVRSRKELADPLGKADATRLGACIPAVPWGRGRTPSRQARTSPTRRSPIRTDGWLLQQITTRLRGRELPTYTDVVSLADLPHDTTHHHDAFEKVASPHGRRDWYADT
jgi:hypothetical protein